MVDHVKSFGEVNRHGLRKVWETAFIETPGYSRCEMEESGSSGVVGTETMLGG